MSEPLTHFNTYALIIQVKTLKNVYGIMSKSAACSFTTLFERMNRLLTSSSHSLYNNERNEGVDAAGVLTPFLYAPASEGGTVMTDEKKVTAMENQEAGKEDFKLSETWAQDALSDLEDWIEEQGIYIRQ